MKKLIVVCVLIVALAGAALAQGNSWTWIIPETWVCVFNFCPGTVQPLIEDVPVPAEFVGQTCTAFATTQNNASVHVGNDVEIISGGQSVFMFDVEGQANATTYQADGPLTLGEDIDMYVHMGQDGRWSAELDMEFVCLDGGPTPTPSNTPSPTNTMTPSPTATESPTVTATVPGPTLTPTSTPAPTGVGLSGMSGKADGPSVWLIGAIVFTAGLFVWTVRKREGE